MKEEQIEVSAADCRRWSADINDKLEVIRARDGEETYRIMFLASFLMLGFAEQLEDGGLRGKLTHVADAELNHDN